MLKVHIFGPLSKIYLFLFELEKKFNVINMMYYNVLSIFMFKINSFKVVIICFIYRYQIFDILKKYDFFSSNNKIFCTYEPKVSKNISSHMVCLNV